MSLPQSKSIVIACAADARYVMPLAVLLESARANLRPGRRLEVYVVDGGIPQADKERLASMLEPGGNAIHWIPSDLSSCSELPVWGRLPRAVYSRILLTDILPRSLPKVIWLDCDIVVQADLTRLWEIEMEDFSALAVQDMIVPYVSSLFGVARHAELGIAPTAKYFNAGVMVVNLERWRSRDVAGQVLDYLKRYREDVVFLEQEGLNVVMAGEWGELDPRWNQNASVSGRAFFKARHLDEAAYAQVVNEPWIVHFNGHLKPWTVHSGNSSRGLYFRYLDRTPWAGWRPRKTLRSVLLGMYDSSRMRRVLYPTEKWGLELVRRATRRRLPSA